MSRIGKRPIQIPDKVKVRIESRKVFVEGGRGKLTWEFPEVCSVRVEGTQVIVQRTEDSARGYSMHGLTRTYISNMIKGVSEGYSKQLELHGVGYRAQMQGKNLNLQLGFSHPVVYHVPEDINVKAPKPNQIVIEGIDKAKVGEVAAEIRSFFKPEPYKGKGIRYQGEYVRKKAGKAVA